ARLREREIADVAMMHVTELLFGAEPYRLLARVESYDLAKAKILEHSEVRAGAGADIKDWLILSQGESGNLATEQTPPADKPPMACLNLGLYGVDAYIHRVLGSFGIPTRRNTSTRIVIAAVGPSGIVPKSNRPWLTPKPTNAARTMAAIAKSAVCSPR